MQSTSSNLQLPQSRNPKSINRQFKNKNSRYPKTWNLKSRNSNSGNSKFSSLALKIIPGAGGTAVCSSSSLMGHSLSFGSCDLCTVVSDNAAIADAAATLGGNMVKTEDDLGPAAEKLSAIPGVTGVLLIKNDQLAIAGKMPSIIRHEDPAKLEKITGTFLQ